MIETVPLGTLLRGRYHIERVLGSGGFGHVYLAVDQVSNQQCAVKEYLVTGTTGREQLEHEATVLSRLRHPSLPAYQDAFNERERYYIVLSYIEGNDLTDLIRVVRQRNSIIPIAQILNWLLAICDAVTFLHNQQPAVIHRDIKPDNIRITPEGTAILVDLGNAKAAADGARTLFFIRHQGTPGYAPPEQYPGGIGTDARSDVYALGGTLFFALTTYEPPTVQVRNQSIQQGLPTLPSLQEQLQKNPPEENPAAREVPQFRLGVTKPSKPAPRHSRHIAQLGTLSPQLLARLNNIVQKSMALNPRSRYPLVADFANDLRQVAVALSSSSTPPAVPKPPVDPHSTQPDLSELYEALQEAKEKKSSETASPDPQPALPPKGVITCPRCGTSLASKAAFCTHCGMALSRQANPSPSNQQAKMQHAPLRDISVEKTQVASPSAIKEAIVIKNDRVVQEEKTVSAFSSYTPAQSQQSPWQHLQNPVQANSGQPQVAPQVVGPRGQNQNPQQMQQAKQQSYFAHFLSNPIIIIASIVVLTLLLALIIFLITRQLHP